MKWYEELANNHKDTVVYLPSIGKSVEGRDLPAVHIGTTGATMQIYFQCQIHASKCVQIILIPRILAFHDLTIMYPAEKGTNLLLSLFIFIGEWISGATCMYIADHLVKNNGKSDQV